MPETTTAKSDLTRVPNFDALDTWVTKLKDWCEDAVDELENRLDSGEEERLHERVEALEDLNADLEFKSDRFDELVELFFDMRRGIRHPGEVEGWLKGKGFVLGDA